MTNEILVIGASGKTGRRVVERLKQGGVPVREASRRGSTRFDWNDQETWGPALDGVDAAYITYHPDLTVPAAAPAIRALSELAVHHDVRRLVLLSGRGEAAAQRCEEMVQASGAEWTIVRASWFAQNFSEDFMLEPVLNGEITLPAGDLAEPFIDVDDIADIAAAALTDDRHAGQVYEVTGPRLLTFADVAAEISAATGREVRYVPVTPVEFQKLMTEVGMPAEDIGMLVALFAEILDGRNAHLDDGVQRALGRAPRDFSDYVRATAASGVWRN